MIRTAALALLLAGPASAEIPCMGLADAKASLAAQDYTPQAGGTIADPAGNVGVEVWVHPSGRFWVLYTQGTVACFIQAGTDWHFAGIDA